MVAPETDPCQRQMAAGTERDGACRLWYSHLGGHGMMEFVSFHRSVGASQSALPASVGNLGADLRHLVSNIGLTDRRTEAGFSRAEIRNTAVFTRESSLQVLFQSRCKSIRRLHGPFLGNPAG